jgi:aldehyde:ferredoxin oxidoreductase
VFKGGYQGKILRVDLTSGKILTEPLDETIAMNYIGGRGLGVYLAYREMRPKCDPLSPESHLYFLTGPLQGTLTPFSPKFVIMNRSPLSGSLSRSICGGGSFGPELKYAGFDALVITGKADKPVYLSIDDKKVVLRDATPHWGRKTGETEAAIRNELGDESISVASIGPAGEKSVRYSSVIVNSRAAGRGGAGAVMGSKNLKAIAIRGTGSIYAADLKSFTSHLEHAYSNLKANSAVPGRIEKGTAGTLAITYSEGILPVENFSRANFDKIDGLMPDHVRDSIYVHNKSCFGCPLPCGKTAMIKEGPYQGMILPGPEYETIGLLGSNCGIGDIEYVAVANQLCNDYGLDTISTGNVIAFAIECFQKGLILDKDTDGLKLEFGNGDLTIELIKKIASRESFGDQLAEGTKRLAEKIGQGAEKFAMQSKGQGFAAYEPRGLVGMGLLYATATPGANHSFGPTLTPERVELKDMLTTHKKAGIILREQNKYCLQDSMIFCSFSRYGLDDMLRLDFTNSVTGWSYTPEEALNIANRIYTLERMFNIREGFGRKHDSLPWRSLHEKMPDGPAKGNRVKLEEMLPEYYRERGWDEKTGIPNDQTLERLGLNELVKEFQ